MIKDKLVSKIGPNNKYREMLLIAVPAILESLFLAIIVSIDTQMISELGSDCISAVSFTSQPKLLIYSIFYALGMTTSIFVAQSLGRKDKDEANRCLRMVFRATFFLAVIIGALAALFANPIMSLCNKQSDTLDLSVTFFRIIMMGLPLQGISLVLNGALRGIGKTGLALLANIAMGVTDIFFNYLLIQGHWGFPALGVAGDAIATVIGTAAACIIGIIAISRKKETFLSLKGLFKFEKIYRQELGKEFRVKAGNITLENILTRIGFLLSSIIMSCLPASETSVYFVAMILMNYSFSFADGIQSAVLALLGRSMGAKSYDNIISYRKTSLVIGVIGIVIIGALFVICAPWFYGNYFQDEAAIQDGIVMTWIIAGIIIFQILRIINIASMKGMGEVRMPKYIAILSVLLINPGTTAIFVFLVPMGIWGVWISSVITQVVWFILSLIFCKKNMKKVKELLLC